MTERSSTNPTSEGHAPTEPTGAETLDVHRSFTVSNASVHGMYAPVRSAERIWVIGAIHGDARRLSALHDQLAPKLNGGDAIVYLGNYLGWGDGCTETIDELLRFRGWFLSLPPFVTPQDIVYLRGAQEEMLDRLLQIQFASDPKGVLTWMLEHGLAQTLTSYGAEAEEVFSAASVGTLALTYWTNAFRNTVKSYAGHNTFLSTLKRAAFLDNGAALFVSAGLDVEKPLRVQTDALWWAMRSFEEIDAPYRGYGRVFRGVDPTPRGFLETEYTVSLDGGSGRGGDLIAVRLNPHGQIREFVSA